jgi:hypothetical protein
MPHIINDQERILTYAELKRINDSSVNAGRNRNLYFDRLPIHDDGTVYPIAMSFMHNDIEMRTTIIFNADGLTGVLDMSFDEYEQLSTQKKIKENA